MDDQPLPDIPPPPPPEPPPGEDARNALILGGVALVTSFLVDVPGLISAIGCVAPVAALITLTVAIRGWRKVGEDNQARTLILFGLALGLAGAVIFAIQLSSGVDEAQDILDSAREEATAATVPHVFVTADGQAELTYTENWLDMTADACVPYETDPSVECELVIGHPARDGTNISLIISLVPESTTTASLYEQSKDFFPEDAIDLVDLNGEEAVFVTLTQPSDAMPTGEIYIEQYQLVRGAKLYALGISSPGPSYHEEHAAALEPVLASFRLLPEE